MAGSITNVSAEMTRLRKHVQALVKAAQQEIVVSAQAAFETAVNNTVVWSGETVRNYQFGLNARPQGQIDAIASPADPGRTNEMGAPPAGEPRRAANEGAARAGMTRVIKVRKKFEDYYFVNTVNSAKWDLIDNGAAPTTDKSRHPGGITKLVEQTLRARGTWE